MHLDWFDIVVVGVNRSEDQASLMLGISQIKKQSPIIATAQADDEQCAIMICRLWIEKSARKSCEIEFVESKLGLLPRACEEVR